MSPVFHGETVVRPGSVRKWQWLLMRLYRLLSLLDALRLRHGPVTARQIAEVCGISLRTAYRDIADLQAMGAPIRGEGGVGYP
jgi:predicted DNA-binding transcriptional regulator YafY